jgi:hypothetical protein
MQITVKVKPGSKNPKAAVRGAIKRARPASGAASKVEEVFPGERTGHRAGMMTVTLAPDLSDDDRKAVLGALREHAEIEYAEPVRPRASRKRR